MILVRDPVVAIVLKTATLIFRSLCYLHSFDSENAPKGFALCLAFSPDIQDLQDLIKSLFLDACLDKSSPLVKSRLEASNSVICRGLKSIERR